MSNSSYIVDLSIFDSFNFFPKAKVVSPIRLEDPPIRPALNALDLLAFVRSRVHEVIECIDEGEDSDSDEIDSSSESVPCVETLPEFVKRASPFSSIVAMEVVPRSLSSRQNRFVNDFIREVDKALFSLPPERGVVDAIVWHRFNYLVSSGFSVGFSALEALILYRLMTVEKNPGPNDGKYTSAFVVGAAGVNKPLIVEYTEQGVIPSGSTFHLSADDYVHNFFSFFYKHCYKLSKTYVMEFIRPYVTMGIVVPGDAGGFAVGTFVSGKKRVTKYAAVSGVDSTMHLNFPLDTDFVVDTLSGCKFSFEFKVSAIFYPLTSLLDNKVPMIMYRRYLNVVRTGVMPENADDPSRILACLDNLKVVSPKTPIVQWKVFKQPVESEVAVMKNEVAKLKLELVAMSRATPKGGSSMAVDVAKAQLRLGVRYRPDKTTCECGSSDIGNFCADCGKKIMGGGKHVPYVPVKTGVAKKKKTKFLVDRKSFCSKCNIAMPGNFCGECGGSSRSEKDVQVPMATSNSKVKVKDKGSVPVSVPVKIVLAKKEKVLSGHESFTNIFNEYKRQTGKGDEDVQLVRKVYKSYEKGPSGDFHLFVPVGLNYVRK